MTLTSGDRHGQDPVLAVARGSVGSEPVVKQARAELSTTRLLEAAAELIRDRGYEGTTLAAIGERAGSSHGLATRRFGSKEGLLGVLLDRLVMDWREHELRDAIGDLVGADAIEAMVDAVRTSIRRSPTVVVAAILPPSIIGPGPASRGGAPTPRIRRTERGRGRGARPGCPGPGRPGLAAPLPTVGDAARRDERGDGAHRWLTAAGDGQRGLFARDEAPAE